MSSSTNPLSNLGYAYDELHRLTGVSGAQPQSLAYDALGNITSNSLVGGYGYGDAAHKHAATVAGAGAFTYDATGNMLSGNGRALEWDAENRLTKVTQNGNVTTFAYDSTGQRVLKSGPSGTTYTFGQLVEQGPTGLTKYYYAGPLLVAKRINTTPVWFHQDHLGSVRLMTSAAGAKVAGYDYAPFGAAVSASAQVANDRGYGGHATDDTGLVYMNARYYDPQLGRFLSPDNFVPASESSQALNRYAYVYNNPISNTDPTGHLPVVAAIATAVSVGAAVGFTSTAFVIAAVGAATLTTGYILKDPVLTSIGSVLLGISSGYAFGAGFLAAKETVQAAWIGGTVSALTSPVSPLDSNLKSAIGWAYTAQSLLFEFQHLDENIQKGADKLSEKIDLNGAKFQAAKAEKLSALPESDLKLLREPPEQWTAFQRRYGEALETATHGAIKANEAIALNPTGGLVGPGGGFGTRVLDVLTGWIPGVRAHSVLHDLSGYLFNEFGRQGFTAGNGYLYLGLNWFGVSAGNPLSGQVEGLAVTGGTSIGALFPRLF
jgi:RHS repeat-associated protein